MRLPRNLRRLAFTSMFVVAMLGVAMGQTPGGVEGQGGQKPPAPSRIIDGAYAFVSETLSATAPEARVEKYDSSQWEGLWLFHNGFFSETLMRNDRSIYDRGKAQNPRQAGFIARAGAYQLKDDRVELVENISIFPGAVKTPRTFRYRFDEDSLVLVEELTPHVESLTRGTRTIVLRRIKQ